MDVTDELLNLCPTISDSQQVAAGDRNRPSDADLRPLEPLPQTPQSRYPPAADPRPVNPEENRRGAVRCRLPARPRASRREAARRPVPARRARLGEDEEPCDRPLRRGA